MCLKPILAFLHYRGRPSHAKHQSNDTQLVSPPSPTPVQSSHCRRRDVDIEQSACSEHNRDGEIPGNARTREDLYASEIAEIEQVPCPRGDTQVSREGIFIAPEEALFPKLPADSYQTFRRLMNADMPETFAQWKQQQTSKKDEHCREWYPFGICVDVEVTPNEFIQFCGL